MKRVLVLANSSSGFYQFRNELLLKLVEEGYEVHISFPDDTNNAELEAEGAILYHTDINRRGMNPVQDIDLYREYRKLIKEIKPEVVLTYTIKPNVYGGYACRRAKVPYIANITGLGSALENGGVLQKIALILYKIGLKKAKCVFLQNEANKEFFEKHRITQSPLELIPGSGVNLDRFTVTEMPKDKIVFLFISRVMKEKGIEEYLEAARVIKGKYPETEFKILGQCEEDYEEIIHLAEVEGIVTYVGRVNDVRPYLAEATALIHPSYYPEGMSNVCLEAAASGRIVVTTDRPGCREVVNKNVSIEGGKSGYVVSVKDANQLIEALEELLKLDYDYRKQMGLNGREYVSKCFDRHIVISRYLSKIQECG